MGGCLSKGHSRQRDQLLCKEQRPGLRPMCLRTSKGVCVAAPGWGRQGGVHPVAWDEGMENQERRPSCRPRGGSISGRRERWLHAERSSLLRTEEDRWTTARKSVAQGSFPGEMVKKKPCSHDRGSGDESRQFFYQWRNETEPRDKSESRIVFILLGVGNWRNSNMFESYWWEYSSCCSVDLSYPTLCNPMDCSTPALPVLHHLPEFVQNSRPLSWWCHPTISSSLPSSPFAFSLSQPQGLFQWVSSSYQVAKVLELQLQHQSLQWILQ